MTLTTKQRKFIDKACAELGDIDDRICRLVESGLFDDFDGDLEDLVSTMDDLDYSDFCSY